MNKYSYDLVQFTTGAPDTSDTTATRVLQEQHERDTSEKFLILITTGVKTFSYSHINYMASERLQGEEQFHSKYFIWKCLIPMPKCV